MDREIGNRTEFVTGNGGWDGKWETIQYKKLHFPIVPNGPKNPNSSKLLRMTIFRPPFSDRKFSTKNNKVIQPIQVKWNASKKEVADSAALSHVCFHI